MRRILFIAPVFFGYYKEIIKEMENLGFEVDYFCDSASNSSLFKALSRVKKAFVEIPMKKYFYKEVWPRIKSVKYDYVFMISAMSLSFTPKMIEEIKEIQKDAKFIMYQWDGEKNIPYIVNFHKYFDENYTFDRIDAENKKDVYKFLPLFYIKEYENVGKENNKNFEYDVSYVGTAHPQKYVMINEVADKIKDIYPKQFIYHYLPSKFKYIYHKIKDKEYKKVKLSDFRLEKISKDKLMEIFSKSKCIIDAPQKGQNGLTIRSIECLGAKRKLITTNKDIVNYDFYNEKNILIYDGILDINSSFFVSDFEELESTIYESYSLTNWIKFIIK